MKRISFTYWRDGKFYIGFLNPYPDYQTQGKTETELTENLKGLLKDIESREVPYISWNGPPTPHCLQRPRWPVDHHDVKRHPHLLKS